MRIFLKYHTNSYHRYTTPLKMNIIQYFPADCLPKFILTQKKSFALISQYTQSMMMMVPAGALKFTFYTVVDF